VTDAPCANLGEELLKAYPNAKVVLNVRDVDKWLASMETSYYDILGWRALRMLAAVNTVPLLPSPVSSLLSIPFISIRPQVYDDQTTDICCRTALALI
jgi:Sulfotransferase domain